LLTSLASVGAQVGKHRLPGGPGSCTSWKQCSERKSNWCLKINIFTQRSFFWSQVSCGEINIMEKITTGCSSDAGCNHRVVICSHQPLLSISRAAMMQVFCLRSSSHWLGTLSCD